MPHSKPFKVKVSFINKFSLPSKALPKINISSPLGVAGVCILGPAPLEGQPPSVKNRSLIPQAEDPWRSFSPSLWVGPSVVSAPEASPSSRASGEGGNPLVQMLQSLSVSQPEALFVSWNQAQGNQTPWKALLNPGPKPEVIHCLPRLWFEEPG